MSKSSKSKKRRERRERVEAARKTAESAIPPLSTGGTGDVANERAPGQLSTMALERRAVAKGWLEGVPAEKLRQVAEENVRLALNAQDERVKVNASKVVVAIVGQVMEQEKRDKGLPDQTHEHHHSGAIDINFAERIAQLVLILDRGGDISGVIEAGAGTVHELGGDGAGPVATPRLALGSDPANLAV